MTKAYVIIKGWGEYSERSTEPAKIYLDREKAEKAMKSLEEIYHRYEKIIHPNNWFSTDFKSVDRCKPLIEAEYKALGFDAGIWDDWELAEAELDEGTEP